MIVGETTFAKAAIDYFKSEPHGRKLSATEITALTDDDKRDLCEMLREIGYNIGADEKGRW